MSQHRRINRIIGAAVFVIALATYLKTLAPSVPFWDSGEFIATSYIFGVPHPPGAPLYILLGRLFTFLPIGEIPWRVNLISALASALSILFVYLITVRLIQMWRDKSIGSEIGEAESSFVERLPIYAGGVIAALSLAFSDTFWFNAVEAEVYGPSILFTTMGLWLVLRWGERRDEPGGLKILFLVAYLFGLAGGVHILCFLTIPSILLILLFHRIDLLGKVDFWIGGILATLAGSSLFLLYDVRLFSLFTGILIVYALVARKKYSTYWLVAMVLFIIGYTTYMTILIRSGLNPAIDENNPETWRNFIQFLQRKQYGEEKQFLGIFGRKAPFWSYQVWSLFVKYFFQQFPLPFARIIATFRTAMRPTPTSPPELMPVAISLIPLAMGFLGMYLHCKRDWKRFLAFFALFLIMGLGLVVYIDMADPQPRERDYFFVGAFATFAIWMGMAVAGILGYLRRALVRAGIGSPVIPGLVALVFLLMPAGFLAENYHSHDRTGDYIAYDYGYNILQTCEKDAILFTNGDNDTFPLWFLQEVEGIRKDVRVVNLSLLNTDWYIKQLRDFEPKVPIKYGDRYIDEVLCGSDLGAIVRSGRIDGIDKNGRVIPWTTKQVKAAGLTWEMPAPEGYAVLRVQDVMVYKIIQWNNWKKPIYFAVTVANENKIGLDDYLTMEGMAFRLSRERGVSLNPERTRHNLWEVYQYRGLKDPRVYKDDNTMKLLVNYRASYFQLAHTYRSQGRGDAVYDTLKRCDELIPMDWGDYYWSAQLCAAVGKKKEGVEFLEKAIELSDRSDIGRMLSFAAFLIELDALDKAAEMYQDVISQDPSLSKAYYGLAIALERKGDYQRAMETLEELLKIHPEDEEVKKAVQALRKKFGSGKNTGR